MAQVYRGQTLQVRDARAVSNRDELQELRSFFDSGPVVPPPDALSPSKPTKKLSKSRSLFSIGKRDQPDQIESVKGSREGERLLPQPEGTFARKLGGHTVYMLGNTNKPNYAMNEGSFATLPVRPTLLSQQTRSASYSHHPLPASTLRRPSILKMRSDTNVRTPVGDPFLKGIPPASRSSDNQATISDLSGDTLEISSSALRSPMNSYSSLHPVPEISPPNSETQSRGIHPSGQAETCGLHKSFKDACVQTDDVLSMHRRGIEETVQQITVAFCSDNKVEGISLPLTPPPSSTSLGVRVEPLTSSTPPQPNSQRRRRRRRRMSKAPLDPSQYDTTHSHFEILDLELMEDKEQAFEQLVGIYKQHKFLRDAEDELHQQQLGDVSAGLVAQKEVNRKLVNMLKEKGVSMQEIRAATGACIEVNLSSSDIVLSPRSSPDLLDIDASRFYEGQQLDRFRDFQAPESNKLHATSSQGDRHPLFKTLEELPTPVPTKPLPSVPTRSSMFVPRSSMMASPMVRSKSLTENTSQSIDADSIDERMRRLEMAFNFPHRRKRSGSTFSANFSPSKHTELDSLLEEDSSEPASDSHAPFESCTTEFRTNRDNSPSSCSSSYGNSYSGGLHIHAADSAYAPFIRLTSGESSSMSSSNNVDDTSFTARITYTRPHHQMPTAIRGDVTSLEETGSPGPSRQRRGSLPTPTPSLAGKSPTNSKSPSIDEATWGTLLLGLVKGPDRNSSGTA
ncbi:hypothetical protein FS842_009664 [Serendipita sp. 407]|nr:hypothetical protein FS842_009664 [Serendipita sp. 407]